MARVPSPPHSTLLAPVICYCRPMLRRTLLLATTLWLVTSSTAQADGAFPSIYAGLVGGVAITTPAPAEGDPDPNGIAIGGRAGLTIPFTDIYVGAYGTYHFGEEILPYSRSTLMIGGEGGYEFSFGPLVLRPSLGVGLASQYVTVAAIDEMGLDVGIEANGSDALYLSPGLNFMVALGILVGVEARYNAILTEDQPDSVSVLGTLGFAI